MSSPPLFKSCQWLLCKRTATAGMLGNELLPSRGWVDVLTTGDQATAHLQHAGLPLVLQLPGGVSKTCSCLWHIPKRDPLAAHITNTRYRSKVPDCMQQDKAMCNFPIAACTAPCGLAYTCNKIDDAIIHTPFANNPTMHIKYCELFVHARQGAPSEYGTSDFSSMDMQPLYWSDGIPTWSWRRDKHTSLFLCSGRCDDCHNMLPDPSVHPEAR